MSYLTSISYYLPKQTLSNDQLVEDFGDWTTEKIYLKTGIKQRHVVTTETIIDLGLKASENLFLDSKFPKDKIDIIILATQTPDYLLPTSACILQDRLGLRKNIGAFDFNLGCSAYIYGLAMANSFITSGLASNILFITSETYSKHIHKKDKSVRTLFGDGATASLITKEKFGLSGEIGKPDLGTDGSGWDKLIIPSGGGALSRSTETSKEFNDGEYIRSKDNLYMDGPSIMSFTLDVVPKSISETLNRNNLKIEEIDIFVFHQASIFILNYFKKSLRIPESKFIIEIEDIGNTVSSTIPIALKRALVQGKITRGMKVLLVGFGVGLSWGSTIIQF